MGKTERKGSREVPCTQIHTVRDDFELVSVEQCH